MKMKLPATLSARRILPVLTICLTAITVKAEDYKFHFGAGSPEAGFTQVTPGTAFDAGRGFGYTSAPSENGVGVFAVRVPEGNYRVTAQFGSDKPTSTTIKSESRRLMVEKVDTKPGETVTRSFTVNTRQPAISTGGSVSLKKGEDTAPNWDDLLSFEINGSAPGLSSLEIKPAGNDVVTVFLAGDSTVTDQGREPWTGWGQMLPRFFKDDVAVSNHAWSGLTLSSFAAQKRLQKILSMLKKGDYVFVQFGHNDQKEKGENKGPFTSYKENLKKYVADIRGKGGNVVLVTPIERRRFGGGGDRPRTLADYAEAVRQTGAEENVPVIDLNEMSYTLYGALGPENSKKAFVHYPAGTYPNQDKPLKDDTHTASYGGYELARCVVEGIKEKVQELAKHLANDAGTFDPAKPDDPAKFAIPPSPVAGADEKPEGS